MRLIVFVVRLMLVWCDVCERVEILEFDVSSMSYYFDFALVLLVLKRMLKVLEKYLVLSLCLLDFDFGYGKMASFSRFANGKLK